MGEPPYGCIKDPNDTKKWIVHEEGVEIVKRIFVLSVAGKGPTKIAKIMQSEKVLTVKFHYANQKNLTLPDNPYRWNKNSVVEILGGMECCGHTVSFKTYSKSNKLKKRIETPKEQQLIFRDTHEAIIDEAVCE